MKKITRFLLISISGSLLLMGCDTVNSSKQSVEQNSSVQTETNLPKLENENKGERDAKQENDSDQKPNETTNNNKNQLSNTKINDEVEDIELKNKAINWIMVDLRTTYNDETIPKTAFNFFFTVDENNDLNIEVRENHDDDYFQTDENTSPLVGLYKMTTNDELSKMNMVNGGDYEVIGTEYLKINQQDESNE